MYSSEAININQRIRILVDHFTEKNATRFANSIGVVQQRFDRILKVNEKTKKYPLVKQEIIDAILSVYPNVNKIWLYMGEGPMLQDQLHDTGYAYLLYGNPYFNIDFIDGFDLIFNKDPKHVEYYIDIRAYSHADFWCNSNGNMVAMKEIVDKQNDILYGEIYGIVTKGFRTIKRIVQGKNERYVKLLSTSNQIDNTEQEIPISKIEHIFLVLCSIIKK
ncbi:MAG: hypothetical protein LBC84_00550 [Prevotellaceae bacterium]|jgi:hypothetical protein|nr:hypothetical protein [Prevotellaceae bacterium]